MSMNEKLDSPILFELRQAIEAYLKLSVEDLKDEQYLDMVRMMSYLLGWEEENQQAMGKRIRPLLTLLTCATLGGDWQSALPTAAAIELIHNFSLVHDDIEDNSETRRGRPTIWKRWGIAKAINLGDAIFVLSRLSSFRLQELGLPSDRILAILHVLDRACLELTIGQQMDLEFEELPSVDLDTYLRMIQGKTAALVAASTKCGAIIASAPDEIVELLAQYGHHLGLAFQIRDDILGIWGESARTGKSTGDDLRSRKKTLPILFGLNQSQKFRDLWNMAQIDETTLHQMRLTLEESKALQFANEKAGMHTRSALNSLQMLNGKEPFHQELIDLTHILLDREQ